MRRLRGNVLADDSDSGNSDDNDPDLVSRGECDPSEAVADVDGVPRGAYVVGRWRRAGAPVSASQTLAAAMQAIKERRKREMEAAIRDGRAAEYLTGIRRAESKKGDDGESLSPSTTERTEEPGGVVDAAALVRPVVATSPKYAMSPAMVPDTAPGRYGTPMRWLVVGLHPGSLIQLRVRALNDVEWGEPSSCSASARLFGTCPARLVLSLSCAPALTVWLRGMAWRDSGGAVSACDSVCGCGHADVAGGHVERAAVQRLAHPPRGAAGAFPCGRVCAVESVC
jgi:hypothetical protein